MAALVAPPPPCLPEAENRSSYPESAAPSSAKRKEKAYLEEEFGHEPAAAARHVLAAYWPATWGQQLCFIYLFAFYFPNQDLA